MASFIFFILRPPDTSKMGANTEQFVLSSDSIGEDNNFVSYEEEPDSFNVIEPENELSEKIVLEEAARVLIDQINLNKPNRLSSSDFR